MSLWCREMANGDTVADRNKPAMNLAPTKNSNDERRYAPREKLDPIEVTGLTSLDHKTLLSRVGHIVDASKTGFLLHVARTHLVPQEFRDSLSLSALEGDRIILMIEPLQLEIGGSIARTKRLSKELYEICIDFSTDAPEYWREALIDMLPRATDFKD